MSPAAEFNILADPEAARIVLGNSRQDLPVYMVCCLTTAIRVVLWSFFQKHIHTLQVPLEVTHKAIVTSDILHRIQQLNTQFADICISLLTCFADTYREIFFFTDGPPLHDPIAVAFFAQPSLFKV